MLQAITKVLLPLNVIEHVADNYIFDKVRPVKGSIVYVDFIISGSLIQHSGIYVGDGKIVQLNGDGLVELVSPARFISAFNNLGCGSSIYVSCNGTDAVGCEIAADTALDQVGNRYKYSIYGFNCHQFVTGCLDFGIFDEELSLSERLKSTLTSLKLFSRYHIQSDNWRVWDR